MQGFENTLTCISVEEVIAVKVIAANLTNKMHTSLTYC